MGIDVNFKETVTKEQMIEACNYIVEELRKLFPPEKQTTVIGQALIAYTSDGTPNRDLISESLSVRASFPVNSEEIRWEKLYPPTNKDWVAFDPNAPEQPEEVPTEQPPTAVAGEIPMSKVSGVLSEVGFEITSTMEAADGYVLAGKDAEGFSEYFITLDTNKNLRSLNCTIKETGEEDFLTKAMIYMGVCAKIPYEDEETAKKASRFVLDNMDMGMLKLTTEEQTTTIGGWEISLSYIEKSKTYALYCKKVG